MIARPRPAATTLPASLILTQRELKQYRRYQSQTSTLPPKSHGLLPTAAEYADFQSWLTKRDSGYLSDTPLADIACYLERASEKKEEKGSASICGHALHPSYQNKAERCPVCIAEMHITYMKALTAALEAAGGLVKQRWEAVDYECPALQAWYAGKLAFIKEICRLEQLAQDEQDYDRQSQQKRTPNQATSDIKTATQALEIYWDSMEANPSIMQSPCRNKTCAVVFDPETSFERGRDQLYFWRKSPRYEAGGKYASSSDSDEEESDKEECGEQNAPTQEEIRPVVTVTKKENTPGRNMNSEEEQSDEDSDMEDDDDSDEEEDEDDDDDEDEVDDNYVVFEYEEVVIQGAEFVVFED